MMKIAMSDKIDLALTRQRFLAAALLLVAVTSPALTQNVVAMVNGEPITALDIEQRSKLEQLSTHKNPSRQEVLDTLIDEKLKVREAKKWTLEVSDSEVASSYATMATRMHQTPEQLTQNLSKQGIGPNVLKSRIRAEMAWQQLVRGRFQSRLQIDDKDIASALAAKNISDQQAATYDYTMRPVLFLVPPGSSDATFEGRHNEAEGLRGRFKTCEEGVPYARTLRDVTVREPVVRNSSDIPPELRKVVDSVPIGSLTAPERTRLGLEMFAICAKNEGKGDSAEKKQAREALFNERFEAESKRYLQEIRRSSLIEYP